MTGNDKEESRFSHLLQSNRDLAANWCVDVARQLDEYLAELYSASLLDDGYASLNFAEAALLIQGSIQIYSRKVEYLYSLVLQALEFIAQKRQAQQERDSIQVDGNNVHVLEDEEGGEFLNLDDIQEEANIDIDDEEHGASGLSHAAKPPASLLVLEGDSVDIAGDVGELASYQIATSNLHRDFLLLDPCDADAVDKYLNVNTIGAKGTPSCPGSSTHCRTPRSLFSSQGKRAESAQKSGLSKGHRGKRAESAQKSGLSKGHQSAVKEPSLNGVGCSQNATNNLEGTTDDIWKEPCCLDFDEENNDCSQNATYNLEGATDDIRKEPCCLDFDEENNDFNEEFLREHAGSEEHFEDDPWEPLNPHEPGDLYVKPFKRGQLGRKQKRRHNKQSVLESEFPLARINGTTSLEFTKALEAQEYNRHKKQACQSFSTYEMLRCTFILNQNESCDVSGDAENDDESVGIQDECQDHVTFDEFVEPSNNSCMETDVPVQPRENYDHCNLVQNDGFLDYEKKLHGRESFEDLCCSHLDALLQSMSESQKQTELAIRVSTWKHKIEKNLEEQDSHPPFDIHVYGERVLDKLSLSLEEGCENGSRGLKSFAEIVGGQARHEVARTFSALLQLVNNGNVALEKGICGSQSFCFTASRPFLVKLLSSKIRHEEMLRYKAPSMGAVSLPERSVKRMVTHCSGAQEAVKDIEKKGFSNGFKDVALDSGWSTSGKLLSSIRKDDGKHELHSTAMLGSDYERKYSGNSMGKLPVTRCTPENKRRRRCESFKPIEVQMAG